MTASRHLIDIAFEPWAGRIDGDRDDQLRWHQVITAFDGAESPGPVLVGFGSDEGVRRNRGRPGAFAGPGAIRSALGSFALPQRVPLHDAGTVTVHDGDLDDAQARLGAVVGSVIDAGGLPIVLGGGHEVAFGTYLGVADCAVRAGRRLCVLNLDAHFDLRGDPTPSSGTPFLQMLRAEQVRGGDVRYRVVGISQPSNTTELFDTARRFGVEYLADDRCGVGDRERVRAFVDGVLADCDLLYLTIDLDVLPAATAPGVSAPAAYGVPLETIAYVCDRVRDSGKLLAVDVAELNPAHDIDHRTARVAARLVHRLAVG